MKYTLFIISIAVLLLGFSCNRSPGDVDTTSLDAELYSGDEAGCYYPDYVAIVQHPEDCTSQAAELPPN